MHECPICKGKRGFYVPRSCTPQYQIVGWYVGLRAPIKMIACDTCDGNGYLPTESKPLPAAQIKAPPHG